MSSNIFDGYGSYGGYGAYAGYGSGIVMAAIIPILLIAAGLALYFLFSKRPASPNANPVVRWLHNAMSFRTLFTERLLRALYCIVVVFVTAISVVALFINFLSAVLFFVIANIVVRIIFELVLLLMILCRNVQEINDKAGVAPKPAQPVAQVPRPPQAPPHPVQSVRPAAPQQSVPAPQSAAPQQSVPAPQSAAPQQSAPAPQPAPPASQPAPSDHQ